MALIRKRGKIWYTNFTVRGRTVRVSCQTTDEGLAQEYAAKLYHGYFSGNFLGKAQRYGWDAAAKRFLEECKAKTLMEIARKLDWLDQYLGGKYLDEINQDLLRKIRLEREKDVKPTTANRYMEVVRSILKKAYQDWEDDNGNPWLVRVPKFPPFAKEVKRVVQVDMEQFWLIHSNLPEYLQRMSIVAITTGLRASEVCNMQKNWIEGEVLHIPGKFTKNGQPKSVPLPQPALDAIEASLTNSDYVFTLEGRKLSQASTKRWRKALKQAGVENFRWHDLRHYFASLHIMAATPQNVIQTLGGWLTPTMVERYAHLNVEQMRPFANNLCANLSQPSGKPNTH